MRNAALFPLQSHNHFLLSLIEFYWNTPPLFPNRLAFETTAALLLPSVSRINKSSALGYVKMGSVCCQVTQKHHRLRLTDVSELITWSRYFTSFWNKWHFFRLTFKFAVHNLSNTPFNWFTILFPSIIISFIQTKKVFQIMACKHPFWKIRCITLPKLGIAKASC